jgi:hypothetical protein
MRRAIVLETRQAKLQVRTGYMGNKWTGSMGDRRCRDALERDGAHERAVKFIAAREPVASDVHEAEAEAPRFDGAPS